MARLYVLRQIALQLAIALGPAIAVVTFALAPLGGVSGSEWDERTCAQLVAAGASAQAVPCVLLFLLSDVRDADDSHASVPPLQSAPGVPAAAPIGGAGAAAAEVAAGESALMAAAAMANARTASDAPAGDGESHGAAPGGAEEEAGESGRAGEAAGGSAGAELRLVLEQETWAEASEEDDDEDEEEPVSIAPDELPLPTSLAGRSLSGSSSHGHAHEHRSHHAAAVHDGGEGARALSDLAADVGHGASHGGGRSAEAVRRERLGRTIGRLLVGADVLSGLSSGLSVRFFPLFFTERQRMGPVALNALYVVTPLLTALANGAAGRIARTAGQAQTALVARALSLCCLCAIIALDRPDGPASGRWVVALYCLRCCTLYSARPLTRAILMSVVRSDERGRWQSMEALTSFGWSGTAALGGLLIDNYGYEAALIATAALQLVSLALLAPLPALTPHAANGGGGTWRRAKWVRAAAQPLLASAADEQPHGAQRRHAAS